MSERPPKPKLQCTKDYRLFRRSTENRNIDVRKHRALYASMSKNGFIPDFPISVRRDGKGHLEVKDGQHRLAIAEALGLPVWFIECDVEYDIAEINSTAVVWKVRDYAEKYAAQGVKSYVDGLAFADRHGIPVGSAFAILAGVVSFSNIMPDYKAGNFKIKDFNWAEDVAAVYGPMTAIQPKIKSARFLEACMAVCRVPSLDIKRMVQCAETAREKLVQYASRDAYIDMLEDVYNYKRQKLVPLKIEAMQELRKRNNVKSNGANDARKSA